MFFVAGCEQSALMTMRTQNQQAEQRIAAKELELQQTRDQQRVLTEEKQRLISELDSKKLTLDQLHAELDQLERQNARIKASTNLQAKEKQALEAQIRQYRNEIDALQSNQEMSLADKEKRIEELRQKIKAYLEMGLR